MKDKIVALLPMKGHSERIPNKNLKSFNGKPLYHHILNSLSSCSSINTIVIDTDSRDVIADVNENFNNIKFIERPVELRGDFVEMNDIIAYDLSQIEGEYFLQTHSTNPLLLSNTIDKAVNIFYKNIDKYDSIFTVTKFQNRFYDRKGVPINHNLNELLRTQDLPPVFEENSNLYIFSKTSFIKAGNKRIGFNPYMFKMDKLEAVDIDDMNDFILAELIMKARKDKT